MLCKIKALPHIERRLFFLRAVFAMFYGSQFRSGTCSTLLKAQGCVLFRPISPSRAAFSGHFFIILIVKADAGYFQCAFENAAICCIDQWLLCWSYPARHWCAFHGKLKLPPSPPWVWQSRGSNQTISSFSHQHRSHGLFTQNAKNLTGLRSLNKSTCNWYKADWLIWGIHLALAESPSRKTNPTPPS